MTPNFLSIEVFDAFENKRYASFNGHQICDAAIVGNQACQMDSAEIWLDGNDDLRGSYKLGFNGIGRGSVGGPNTRTEFLERIHSFMTQ